MDAVFSPPSILMIIGIIAALLAAARFNAFPLVLFTLALILGVTDAWMTNDQMPKVFVIDRIIRWILFMSVGIQGLWSFIGNAFCSSAVAHFLGWNPGEFQFKLAVYQLSFGVLGSLSYWDKNFWVPCIMMTAIAYYGNFFVHIRDRSIYGNSTKGIKGGLFLSYILVPTTLIALLAVRVYIRGGI